MQVIDSTENDANKIGLNKTTLEDVALEIPNTFGIHVNAQHVLPVHTESELVTLWQQATAKNQPVLMLGSGSNVLILENFAGTVLLNRIRGIQITESADAWHLHIGAGEVWNDLVNFCLDRHIPGLENLALIPGRVGSAPVQNIGAYGVELEQFCKYVDVIQLKTGEKFRLNKTQCKFGFRESIFKHELREHHAIVAVGLCLKKAWQPILNYGDLKHLDPQQVTPRQIYNAVCTIRRSKLPDPAVLGNAGSFFKNPIINSTEADNILQSYLNAPHHPQSDGRIKVAAGWLIEQCGLKGFKLGNAAVCDHHALVLINNGNASGREIAALANHIRQQVANRFAIWLEPEVRFVGKCGEVDAFTAIS